MDSRIIGGVPEELAGEIRQSHASGYVARKRIRELIGKAEEASVTALIAKSAYEKPNWDYQQADLSGYIRALRECSRLLED